MALARVFQAVGFPLLFVPITTISYAGLPPGKSGDASALVNSMRNLGASVGISMATTLLARRGQFHQSRLVESITPFAPSLHFYPPHSPAVLHQLLEQQATMWSYIDAFWLVTLIAAAVVPLTFALRKIEPGEEHAGH